MGSDGGAGHDRRKDAVVLRKLLCRLVAARKAILSRVHAGCYLVAMRSLVLASRDRTGDWGCWT